VVKSAIKELRTVEELVLGNDRWGITVGVSDSYQDITIKQLLSKKIL
jgi:hypothetical protein